MKLILSVATLLVVTCCTRHTDSAVTDATTHVPKDTIENSIGVVFLDSIFEKDTVKIFNRDGTVWLKFTFLDEELMPEVFLPFAFHKDNLVLVMKCAGVSDSAYTFFVNDHETKFAPRKNSKFKFSAWHQFILSGRVSIDVGGQGIYTDTIGSSAIKKPNTDFFTPVSINGEWLELKWHDYDVQEERRGWIRWLAHDKFTVRLVFI